MDIHYLDYSNGGFEHIYLDVENLSDRETYRRGLRLTAQDKPGKLDP
jgi:hypothetical protein